MKMKKIFSAFMATVFLFGIINMMNYNAYFVLADTQTYTEVTENGLSYHVYKDHAEMYKCSRDVQGEVVIPRTVNGVPVTVIGEYPLPSNSITRGFLSCNEITSIVLPDSVEVIGRGAFKGCRALKTIKIPNSVHLIEGEAFISCEQLTSIILPDDIAQIGIATFYGCTSLESIKIPDRVTQIDRSAFEKCASLESITIPKSVENIGEYVFAYCNNLKSLTILNDKCNISVNCFAQTPTTSKGYALLGSHYDGIIYGYEESTAHDFADYRNFKFESIINESKGSFTETTDKGITYRIFNDHAELIKCSQEAEGEISIPETINDSAVTSINRDAFKNCISITSIFIPSCITTIGKNAFHGCKSLSSIIIPDSVKYIGGFAFEDTPWLDSLRKSNSLVIINNILIDGRSCEGEVEVPKGVRSIGEYAFYEGDRITSITLPTTVDSINYMAFYSCQALSSITVLCTECDFNDSFLTICNNVSHDITDQGKFSGTIWGYNGSTAQLYAEKYHYNYESLEDEPAKMLGDENGDGNIDALDASRILALYAKFATEGGGSPTEQDYEVCDVDRNGSIDAVDASKVLAFYAYMGGGGTGTFEEFLKK